MKLKMQKIAPYLFLTPYMILFSVFGIYCIGYSLYISFFKWGLRGYGQNFVGFTNYIKYLTKDPFFIKSILNSFVFMVFGGFLSQFIAFFVAILLSQKFVKGTHFFKVTFFLPFVTSSVSIGIMFNKLFDNDFGVVNYVLINIFGFKEGMNVYLPLSIKILICTMLNWGGIGFWVIIFFGALVMIDAKYGDAATIDGANLVQQFFYIKLPLILPVIFFAVFMNIFGCFEIFDEPRLVLTHHMAAELGGLENSGLTPVLYIFFIGIRNGLSGRASAMAWLLAIVIVVLCLFCKWIFDKFDYTKEKKSRRSK